MVTVKDFYDENESIRNEVTIVIEEELPFPDTLWEGLLAEVPEKFYSCEVVRTAESLKALQEGKLKYYLYISEAPAKPKKVFDLEIENFSLVFRNCPGEEFYEFMTLYYNSESKNLIIVCDSDYEDFTSKGFSDGLIEIRPLSIKSEVG